MERLWSQRTQRRVCAVDYVGKNMVKCRCFVRRDNHIKMTFANKTIREWVVFQEMTGHPSFSRADVVAAFPKLSPHAVSNALVRLVRGGVIVSVHKGFFVVIPTRYKMTGVVPPLFYMDALLRYLNRPYYASLLTAAKIWGASHQMAQSEFVTTIKPAITTSKAKNPLLNWVYRSHVPEKLVCVRNGEGGVIRYSSAEFTLLDLVQYAHLVGGLSAVATVLADLTEAVDFSRCDTKVLFDAVKGRVVQRAGFILEDILGEKDCADVLYDAYRATGAALQWTDLRPGTKDAPQGSNLRWKIKINEKVEPDEA